MKDRVCVIVNPAAGRGRGARVIGAVRTAFREVGVADVRIIQAKGMEEETALRAIDDGCTTIVAVGGDGTWSQLGAAIIRAGADCRLALVAAGTGNDFAKSAGVPARDIRATARLAVSGSELVVDVGFVDDHPFLNVAGFGFDVAVLEQAERLRWPPGPTVYAASALRQLLAYRGVTVGVAGPGFERRPPARHLLLAVANGRWFGGAFQIAPNASLTDGLLDAVSIMDASPRRRLALFASAMRGRHTTLEGVTCDRGSGFTLRFNAPPPYEADGEYRRAVHDVLEVKCSPRALRIAVPASVSQAVAPRRAERSSTGEPRESG